MARFGTPSEVAEAYRQDSAPTRRGACLTPVAGATPTGLERFFRLMSLSLSFLLSPFSAALGSPVTLITLDGSSYEFPFFASLVLALIGFVGFFITLHTARGLGRLHASLAKALLVRP